MKNYKFKVKRNARKNILGMRVMFKKCTKCGKVLFRSNFRKDKRRSTGLDSQCIECLNSKYSHTCEQCGKGFKSGQIKSRFCSQECHYKWQSENVRGLNNPNYRRIICNCDYCGKEINKTLTEYKNYKNHFCSQECHYKWKSENWVGKNNPHYRRVICKCLNCGKEMELHNFKKDTTKFCSSSCFYEYNKGENNYNYNPNKTQEEREQGRNIEGYRDFIKGVYERDNYTCQCCGKRGNGEINAHHIYGYAEYKDLRTDVDNGVTLCEDCHKEYHKQYGYKNNNYKDFRTFLYNEMMKQNTLEARLFYINTIEDITLRLEIRGLLELESA